MDTSYQSMFSTLMKRSHTNLFHTSDCKLKVSGLWSVVILLNKNGTFELSKFNLVLGSFSKKIFHIFKPLLWTLFIPNAFCLYVHLIKTKFNTNSHYLIINPFFVPMYIHIQQLSHWVNPYTHKIFLIK